MLEKTEKVHFKINKSYTYNGYSGWAKSGEERGVSWHPSHCVVLDVGAVVFQGESKVKQQV